MMLELIGIILSVMGLLNVFSIALFCCGHNAFAKSPLEL